MILVWLTYSQSPYLHIVVVRRCSDISIGEEVKLFDVCTECIVVDAYVVVRLF